MGMLPRKGRTVMWLWKNEGTGPSDVRLAGADQVAGTAAPGTKGQQPRPPKELSNRGIPASRAERGRVKT